MALARMGEATNAFIPLVGKAEGRDILAYLVADGMIMLK
jgi:hypothetical protein